MKHAAPLLVLLAAGLAACQSGPPSGVTPSEGFPAPGREIVWEASVQALAEQGFALDRDASSPATGTLVSRWSTSLQPFSGQGHRDQATIVIREVEGRPGYFATDTRVVREFNSNITQPQNPIVADWGSAQRVRELEALLNHRIELYFLPGDVSPEFRRRYGMGPGEGGTGPPAPR